ncbi:MAG TPA: type II secretion system F family protein [Polyangiaceae bacterium]
MAEWVWEARARTGEMRKGEMSADNEEAVEGRLRQQQLTPTKVKKKPREFNLPQFGSGVNGKDLVTFTRLFATMIDAGLPIVQCLDILQGQTDNKIFANVLRDIKTSVEQGSTFSDALRRHPKVFDALYTNLVQAGEVGGILDTILNRLAVYNEKAMKLARQVRGAMVYPSVVLFVFLAVMCILLGFVIPSFKNIFKDLGSSDELPVLTQGVIAASEFFVHNILFMFLGAAALVTGFIYAIRDPRGKKIFHKFLLSIPIIGPVLRKIAVARFTRTLGTLLSSGVPILDALEIVAKTAGNVIVEEAILYTRLRISEGKNMAGPLTETNIFPPMVVQMVGVGEQTGALDAMLSKIADFYEEEVDVAVSSLTSLIEPAMMVGIGGTVGVVLIAMYLPIFSIAGKIKGG